MPNTFGTSSQPFPLCDPRLIHEARSRLHRQTIKPLSLANSFYCPGGKYPCRGWILLRRSDYDEIDKYATDLVLEIDDFKTGPLRLQHLSIVQAQSVSTGLAADEDAVYLVEITDRRGLIWNRWFQYPIDRYYNVLSPAYPGYYYQSSMNAGISWTWATMIGDLWAQLSGFLGAFPGIPIAPANEPMNFRLAGVPIWPALNGVLSHLGLAIAVDLRQVNPYTIVNRGVADAAFTALQTQYRNRLEDDLEWIDVGAGRVPGTVSVFFRRVNQFYGTEETVRRDSLQWETSSLYQVDIAAPAFFAGASGTHTLRDDFCVRFDVDNNPLAVDVAKAAVIASERVQQYYNDIYNGTSGNLWRMYAGVVPFVTGSQCDGVCWRQQGQSRGDRTGWRTEIVRNDDPLWPDVYSDVWR